MKRLILISLVALGIIAVPQNVEAQGFLKKLSKGLESVNKGLDKAGDKASVATGQAVTQENGVFVMNPVSKAMNVEVVKAIGRSTSENFGDVELVLRVNVKEPVSSIALLFLALRSMIGAIWRFIEYINITCNKIWQIQSYTLFYH